MLDAQRSDTLLHFFCNVDRTRKNGIGQNAGELLATVPSDQVVGASTQRVQTLQCRDSRVVSIPRRKTAIARDA